MSKTVSELQKVLGQVAKDEPGRRFHSLYDKVCRWDVLWAAWLQVQENGGSGGIDGKELSDYDEWDTRKALLDEIQQELVSGSYRPQPVRRTYIEKPDGGERPLGIPTIKDRVVQTAVKLILEPIFEVDFHEFSYGFRPGKSCHQACQAVWKWMNFGYTKVIDADIRKYFDTIPHDKLLRSVSVRVSDGKILWLLRQWLKTPISEDGRLIKSLMGTPQGGVISPLLANIYLHHLDSFWMRKGYARDAKLVRYADDFVVMCKGQTDFYLSELRRLLDNLELELSDTKTQVVESTRQGFDFLGFHFRRVWAFRPKRQSFGWVTGVRLSRKAVKKARQHMNELVGKGGRKSPVPMLELVTHVNGWLRHWLPYYCYANDRRDFRHVYVKVVLERLVRAEVARKSNGNKRRCGKWKSFNPKLWERKYGLVDVVEDYYRQRKRLYATLFEHPINALA
jgi:group II intron reverse transcriptase/maturase